MTDENDKSSLLSPLPPHNNNYYVVIKVDKEKSVLPSPQAFLYFLIDDEMRLLLLSMKKDRNDNDDDNYIMFNYSFKAINKKDISKNELLKIKRETSLIYISHDEKAYYEGKIFFIKETGETMKKGDIVYYENAKYFVSFNNEKISLREENDDMPKWVNRYHLTKTEEEKLINRGSVYYEVDFHVKFVKDVNPKDVIKMISIAIVFEKNGKIIKKYCCFTEDENKMNGKLIYPLDD